MLKASRSIRWSSGSTLLEVLVSMLLLSMGMLSMGAMHARAAQATRVGQHLAIASQLAADLGERMRANAAAARQGAYDIQAGNGVVTGASPAACLAAACSASELAAQDIAQWSRSAAEQLPGAGLVAGHEEGDVAAVNIWMVWREANGVTLKPDDAATSALPAASRRCPSGINGLDGSGDELPRCLHFKVSL